MSAWRRASAPATTESGYGASSPGRPRVARLSGRRPAAPGELGQASVELIGALPALLIVGLVIFQVFAVGYAAVLAGNAAEAGALAIAGGADAREAAREAVPGWTRARMRVTSGDDSVQVEMRPPTPIGALASRFTVRAEAAVGR